jgi:hypothetical protein
MVMDMVCCLLRKRYKCFPRRTTLVFGGSWTVGFLCELYRCSQRCVCERCSVSFLRSERSSNFHYGTLSPQHQASAVVSLSCRPCSVVMVNELFCLFCFGLPAGLVCFDCLVLDRLNFPLHSNKTRLFSLLNLLQYPDCVVRVLRSRSLCSPFVIINM